MGIHGLWRLLEPAGRDVTLESLENKVLAIDVSLWLHQAQQGASYGGAGVNAPHAHLLTLFHRISKLLFYRVKPVFVFDGLAPELKKKTIFARKQKKQVASNKAKEVRQQLLLSLAKSEILKTSHLPNENTELRKIRGKEEKSRQEEDDLYVLPSPSLSTIPSEEPDAESVLTDEEDGSLMSYYEVEEEASVSYEKKGKVQGGWKKWNTWTDPHEVDLQSKDFQSLPVDVRREILTDLKEARKQSSWGRLHKMPKDLGNFSNFQMSRLLHRRKVQEVLEKVEEEVASSEVRGTSLKELEVILAEKGIESIQASQRIASDESKGFVLLSRLRDQNKGEEIDEKMDDPTKVEKANREAADPHGEEEGMLKVIPEQSFVADCSALIKGEGMSKFLKVNEDIEMDEGGSEILWPNVAEKEKPHSSATNLVISATGTSKMDTDVSESSKIGSFISNSLDEDSCGEDLSQGELMAIIKAQMPEAGKDDSGSVGKCENEAACSQYSCVPNVEELKDGIGRIAASQELEDSGLTQEEVMSIICGEQRNLAADERGAKKGEIFCRSATAAVGQSQAMPKYQTVKTALDIGGCEGVAKVASQQLISSETEEVMHNSSGDSESDGSGFLEVEECEESTGMGNASCVATLDPPKGLAKPICTSQVNRDLELIVNLDSNSDDDMFADVFNNVEVKGDIEESCTRESEDAFILDTGKNKEVAREVIELGSNEECMKETLASELDSQIKVIRDHGHGGEEKVMDVEMSLDERRQLTLEMRKREREANGGVTEKARLESQELLGLFGVPWVVAPFEAEAQCAFLESVVPDTCTKGASSSTLYSRPLAEGTVTEDSDVWAFGASVVYRHVFDRRVTRVRMYSREEIQKRVGLTRAQIIQLALLTGSDYTVGLAGIGTVAALEVLAAFPGEKDRQSESDSGCEVDEVISGLQHFADWWRRVEMNEMERTPIGHSYFDPPEAVCVTLRRRLLTCWKAVRAKQPGMSLLPPGFPSRAVVAAYLQPSVDESQDAFSWLKPDEAALRSYAKVHFGWTQERIDSVLRPLFARIKLSDQVDRTQTSLNSYFSRISPISMSIDLKGTNLGFRTQKALERIAGKCGEQFPKEDLGGSEGEEDAVQGVKKFNEVDCARKASGKLLRNKFAVQNVKSRAVSKGRTSAETTAEVMNYKKRANLSKNSVLETGFETSLYSNAKIPQREKDNMFTLQNKLKAIEVMRKVSLGSGKRSAPKRLLSRKTKLKRQQVELSESSDSD